MATYKRIDGDWNITSVNAADNVNITTNTLNVLGNLDVEGNLTYINVTELNVKDPFIVLNSSNTGSYPSNSGILTHKTVSDFAGIRWSNTTSQWELSSSTTASGETGTWTPLTAGGNIGGGNTDVQFNDGGFFGGNSAFTFDKTTNRVNIQGHVTLGNLASAPAIASNAVALFNQEIGAGDTGVYVKSIDVDDELVSRNRAIAFSLIF